LGSQNRNIMFTLWPVLNSVYVYWNPVELAEKIGPPYVVVSQVELRRRGAIAHTQSVRHHWIQLNTTEYNWIQLNTTELFLRLPLDYVLSAPPLLCLPFQFIQIAGQNKFGKKLKSSEGHSHSRTRSIRQLSRPMRVRWTLSTFTSDRLTFCILADLVWGNLSYCIFCVLKMKIVAWVVKPAETTTR